MQRRCSICHEALLKRDATRIAACGHSFHKTCAKRWFAPNGSCPLCTEASANASIMGTLKWPKSLSRPPNVRIPSNTRSLNYVKALDAVWNAMPAPTRRRILKNESEIVGYLGRRLPSAVNEMSKKWRRQPEVTNLRDRVWNAMPRSRQKELLSGGDFMRKVNNIIIRMNRIRGM